MGKGKKPESEMMKILKLTREVTKRNREVGEAMATAALNDLKAMGAPQYVLQDAADIMFNRKNKSGVE